jgi:hypothetical protein
MSANASIVCSANPIFLKENRFRIYRRRPSDFENDNQTTARRAAKFPSPSRRRPSYFKNNDQTTARRAAKLPSPSRRRPSDFENNNQTIVRRAAKLPSLSRRPTNEIISINRKNFKLHNKKNN